MIDKCADSFPGGFLGSCCGISHEVLQLGKDLLYGVDVGAIWRQEQDFCASRPDRSADGRSFVTAEIIEDDDVAWRQCRDHRFLDGRS